MAALPTYRKEAFIISTFCLNKSGVEGIDTENDISNPFAAYNKTLLFKNLPTNNNLNNFVSIVLTGRTNAQEAA